MDAWVARGKRADMRAADRAFSRIRAFAGSAWLGQGDGRAFAWRMGEAHFAGRILALFLFGICSTSCASTFDPGAGLHVNAMSAEMRSLVEAARAGDKLAQLELGERFEEGRGVAVDIARARKLYAAAAADSGGPILVYTPSVGQAPGQLVQIDQKPRVEGLAAAKTRLQALAGKVER